MSSVLSLSWAYILLLLLLTQLGSSLIADIDSEFPSFTDCHSRERNHWAVVKNWHDKHIFVDFVEGGLLIGT
jgi:hypothetical protein